MTTTMASSLVSCLRFAVPLVRSDANASSICSKSTLGAMVMEAHRLAQQAVALHLDPNDPRRVLTKLVSLDDQLSRLTFNDITWDSEGIVAQSLEMELQDLEERANASQLRNFCVLLTARQTEGFEDEGESALLWFPRADEADGNNSSQKYLLYVVPGRIKIVKSLAELVKKMLEEIPTLRASSATYHVWTLIEAKDNHKKKMKEKPVLEAQTSPPKEKLVQEAPVVHPKREETPEEILEPALLQAAKPKPLRVRVHERGLTDQPSMFQFPRVQQPTKPSAPVHNELSEAKRSPVPDEPPTQTTNVSHSPSQTVGFDAEPNPNASGSPIIRQSDSTSRDVRAKAFVSCTNALPGPVPSGESDDHSGWRSLDGVNRRLVVAPAPQPVPTTIPDAVVQPTTKAQIRLLQREYAESMFQFSGSRELERPHQHSESHSSERTAPDPTVDTSHGGCSEIVDDAVTETTTESVKPKKRSARDHYRNKLGARGWWELEYQVSKILEQQLPSHQPQAAHVHTVGVRGDRHVTEGASKWRNESKKPSLPGPVEATAHAPNCTSEKTTDLKPEQPQQNTREVSSHVEESPVRSNEAIKDLGDHVDSQELSPSRQERNAKVQSPEPTPQSAAAWQEGIVQAHSSRRVSRAERSDAKVQSPEPTSSQGIVRPVQDNAPLRARPSKLKEDDITAERTTFQRMPTTGEDDFVEVPSRTSPVILHTSSLNASEVALYQARSPLTQFAQENEKPEQQVSTSLFARKHPSKHEIDEQDSVLMATMNPRNPRGAIIHNGDRWEPTAKATSSDDDASIHARPFHALGRVPIRSRQEKDSRPRQRISPVSSDDDEDDGPVVAPLKTTATISETPVIAPNKTSAPPVVESFTVESPVRSHDEATQRARQQKLTELRQKKIQQLQKARDEAMGKKKLPLPKAAPASELLLDRAMAVGPPTTIAGADESFSMPGHSTHARVRKPTNRKLIQNAIEYTLLAGGSLDKERHAALQALSESSCDNFIVLLKSAKELKFRALYEHHIVRGRVVRIFSTASSSPPMLTDDVISQFFRYNSGKKEFAAIDAREFTVKTDACALVDQLVFKKKALNRIL